MAVAAINNGKPDKAEEMVIDMRVGGLTEKFPQSHQIMGLIHSQRGDFEKAAVEYRAYLEKAPGANGSDEVKKQLNEWEVLGVIEPATKQAAAQ